MKSCAADAPNYFERVRKNPVTESIQKRRSSKMKEGPKKKEKKRSQKRRLLVQWSQSLSLSPVVVVVRGEREVRKGGQG